MSATAFALKEAQAAGLAFVGEPTDPLPQITRAAPTGAEAGQGTGEPENSWDLLQKLAEAEGMVCFVAGNTMYFGRPTWLRARPGVPEWKVRYPLPKPGEIGVHEVPRCRHSTSTGSAEWRTEIEFKIDPASGNLMRPGDRVKFRGVPTFEGTFLITEVTITFDNGTPTAVKAIMPVEKIPPVNPAESGLEGAPAYTGSTGGSVMPGVGVTSGYYIWPVTGRPSGSPSGDFGPRTPPVPGASSFHRGVDIGMPTGAPVVAAAAGVVSIARHSASAGNFIEVTHPNGQKTRYLHLSQFLVTQGQAVGRGQQIGLVGSTGTSSGPHLHFEIWVGGQPVDPVPRLPA
jgi:hypothetical protein